MLNEFESCSSPLFRSKSTHSPCSACCRKRVGWIRCKCNQNLERNESARRVSFVGKRYSIARSFAKNDDAYGLHRTGVDVCSNERECVEALRRTTMHTVYTGLVWACVRMNGNV